MEFEFKKFPILYGKDSEGRIREWKIQVNKAKDMAQIVTEHGLQNGKKQRDIVFVKEGKNIGKANETTVFEQAISEALSKWNTRKDKGYAESIEEIPEDMLPMLAKKYGVLINGKLKRDTDHKHIEFPCYVQPKLDGVRCLTKRVNGVVEFLSRNGKRYKTLKHIEKELMQILNIGEVLDGEIYVHGEEFQDVISAVKNEKGTPKIKSSNLKYYIYDYADKTFGYDKRLEKLRWKFNDKTFKHLVLVDTRSVNNEKQIVEAHDSYVNEGYEGVIIRNSKGKYEFKNRSNNLQKLKQFFDSEYRVVGVKSGIGRNKDCATFMLITKDGKTFDANPKCSTSFRAKYSFFDLFGMDGSILILKLNFLGFI